MRKPTDAWFAAHNLEQSREWVRVSENYERSGFGTPKLRYIARRMRQRIAEFEAFKIGPSAEIHSA
jgi:hypothetical protein